jgi:hypothetical protein
VGQLLDLLNVDEEVVRPGYVELAAETGLM